MTISLKGLQKEVCKERTKIIFLLSNLALYSLNNRLTQQILLENQNDFVFDFVDA